MEEIWKDIKGYKGLYQVSNLGRVKSMSKYVNNRYTGFTTKEKILKPLVLTKGYLGVRLHKKDGGKTLKIHRLVYETFYGKIPFWLVVNHINEIKSDNRLCNLNLMTCKDNINWGTAIQRRIKTRKLKKEVS